VRKIADQLQHQTFEHIVTNTSQDNAIIVEIICHTTQLKKENQDITSAFLRQDNAGCYNNNNNNLFTYIAQISTLKFSIQ